ncbi:Transposase [Azospirillum endophyticum]
MLGSLMRLPGLDLPAPDHTTFSRRSADLKIVSAPACPGPDFRNTP